MAQKSEQQPTPCLLETPVPPVERIQQELATAHSINDFLGKEAIFARLFAGTLEQVLEAKLTARLRYPPCAVTLCNSGNSHNGRRSRNLRPPTGDVTIRVPRDRNGDSRPVLLYKYQTSTNELKEKIIALYAKGVSTRHIRYTLYELYGVEVSATISSIIEKVWSHFEAWQSRYGAEKPSDDQRRVTCVILHH